MASTTSSPHIDFARRDQRGQGGTCLMGGTLHQIAPGRVVLFEGRLLYCRCPSPGCRRVA